MFSLINYQEIYICNSLLVIFNLEKTFKGIYKLQVRPNTTRRINIQMKIILQICQRPCLVFFISFLFQFSQLYCTWALVSPIHEMETRAQREWAVHLETHASTCRKWGWHIGIMLPQKPSKKLFLTFLHATAVFSFDTIWNFKIHLFSWLI